MEFLAAFWPWYIAGPLIGLYVPLLYMLLNRHFGISSTFRDICAASLRPAKSYFDYNWKEHTWRLVFVAGVLVGGFLAHPSMLTPATVHISSHTLQKLTALGVRDHTSMVPDDLFSWNALITLRGLILSVAGGFLVGFGTRYAEGCTSGHSIHGIATFQWTSLIATLCFFLGGLLSTHILLPVILRL